MSRKHAFVIVVLLCAAGTVFAQDATAAGDGFSIKSRVDWTAGTLGVEIARALNPKTASLPRAKGDAEAQIEARLSGILMDAISPVRVDSSHSFGDLLGTDSVLFARVREIASDAQRDAYSLSADFSSLVVRYTLPLFSARGIVVPLFPAKEIPIRKSLGYVATRKFTGLLISAKGQLPAVGRDGEQAVRPALFPRIYDEQMGVVLEKGMCGNETLARWGMVGYAADMEDSVVLLRAGVSPLIVGARAVFGENPTDIVIPTAAARQILSSPDNIALLKEGRIVIVYEDLD